MSTSDNTDSGITAAHHTRAEELLGLLHRCHARLRRERRWALLLSVIAALLAGLALILPFEATFYLSTGFRTGLMGILLAFTAWIAIRHRKALPDNSFSDRYAQLCEQAGWPELRNGLDLWQAGPPFTPLQELAIRQNLDSIDPTELQGRLRTIRGGSLEQRTLRVAAGLALAGFLLLVLPPGNQSDVLQRTLTVWKHYEPPIPWQFTLEPEGGVQLHGSSFQPVIRFHGGNAPPEMLQLAFRSGSEGTARIRPLSRIGDRTWQAPPMELTTDITWHVRMGRFRSESRHTTVRHSPRLEELVLTTYPPSYTGEESEEHHYPFVRLEVPAGSDIHLAARSSRPLAELQAPPVSFAMRDSLSWEGQLTLSERLDLQFTLEDTLGLANRSPYHIRLIPIDDEEPVVEILQPEESLEIPEAIPVTIRYRALDDYGLSDAELRWQLERPFIPEPLRGRIELESPDIGATETIHLDLRELDLRPRDRLTAHIIVWDNNEIDGPQIGRSRTIQIHLPSLSERTERLENQEQQTVDRLQSVDEQAQRLGQAYRELRDRLRERPEPGWQEQQSASDMDEIQQQLDQAVDELHNQFQELQQQMEQSGQISEETRQASRDLQQLFEELDDPLLQEALEELQEAMAGLDPASIEEALQNFEFNEEQYRQRVQRTLELFRSLQMNSRLERLAAQFSDLSDRQTELAERQGDADPDGQAAQREQQQIRQEASDLQRPLQELGEQAPEAANPRLEGLQQESREELDRILEQMDEVLEAGEAVQPGENPSAIQEEQQNIADRLGRQAGRLQDARQQLQQRQIQVNLLGMQRSLYWLLELSELQEGLLQRAAQAGAQDERFVELGRRQRDIERQFSRVADTLRQISAELPGLSSQVGRQQAGTSRSLSQTLEQMAERNPDGSLTAGRQALGGLNELASMVADAVNQLLNQQGQGQGAMSLEQMGEQMQGLRGQQQEMNQQLQQMINDIQGERLSRPESERLEQLARQQNEIRKQLRRLQQSGALPAGDRRLSELEQIARQMEETINDLRGGSADPLVNERQQNILSRMLETEASIQQQGESEELTGQSAQQRDDEAPEGQYDPEQQIEEIRRQQLDPLYTPFRSEHRELIERYLQRLREER